MKQVVHYAFILLFVNGNTPFSSDKPDTVELAVNTTQNMDCSYLWVNFTCVTSESNPPVYDFLLYEKDGNISHSKSGTWITKISRGGRHVKLYSCIALHAVENVTSSNNVTLTVNGEFCQCKNSFNQFQTFMCT